MARYRWKSPSDWLLDKINTWTEAELRDAIRSLLGAGVDNDMIHDVFQEDMVRDGYFRRT